MNAQIVKNDNFQTVGFEVTSNGRTLFRWGVSGSAGIYYTKNINTNDWCTEIFELVKVNAQLREAEQFCSLFFEALNDSNATEGGKTYDLSKSKKRIEQLKGTIENIIKNII